MFFGGGRSKNDSQGANQDQIRLADGRIRLIFVPLLGLGIPQVTGLFGPISPNSWMYWFGSAYFILISFLVWHGNRFMWMKLRGTPDWLSQPRRRALLLGASIVLYTVPLSILMLAGWYRLAGLDADTGAIRSTTLLCVICVVFITLTYETVYLIRQRAEDRIRFAEMERAKVQAELAALKAQVDPHFMFNSLNTLAGLIEERSRQAESFTHALADMYRDILASRNRELVQLKEEIEFLNNYYSLLKLRFEDAVELEAPADSRTLEGFMIPPVSLQLLLENAVKHNQFTAQSPLRVHVEMIGDHITVWNRTNPSRRTANSTRVGLKNLDERCRLVLDKGIDVRQAGDRFQVTLPLSKAWI